MELAANARASVGFVLQAHTRLSGRMLDEKGAPVAGVCIYLEPAEGRGENGALFFDCSKKGGVFSMEMMPPGKYLLVARDEVKAGAVRSKSTLYYPDVRDPERGTMFSIEAGNYVENLDIRLPSHEKRYKIAGRLEFGDGAPVARATVTFTSPQHGYSESTETDPEGSFGLSVIAGMDGVGPPRSGMFRFMDADPISLSIDSDHEDLKLKLSSASCASLQRGRK